MVRLLRLREVRDVSPEEIHRAAKRFARQQQSNPKAHSYVRAASYLDYVAKEWLRFLGRLKPPSVRRARFADQLEDFAQYMASEQGARINAEVDLKALRTVANVDLGGLL